MRRGAIFLLAALAGCGGGAPAVITGEAFVILATGEEVEAAGAPVRLLVEHLPTDEAVARLCGERRDMLAGTEDEETRAAAVAWSWERRAELLGFTTRAAATADADSRFRLDSVPPGRYRVWVETRVQGERWGWMEPVRVSAGDSLHLTLGNHNADDDPFRCQLLLEMEEDAAGG